MTAETVFVITRVIHIAAGAMGLFVGPGAMLTRKGARWHRLWGKIYVASMGVVAATATGMAIYHPSPFLLTVGVFSFYLAFSGWRILRRYRKGIATSVPAVGSSIAVEAIAPGLAFIASVYLVVAGLLAMIGGHAFGSVSLTFGVVGIGLAAKEAMDLVRPPADAGKRFGNHIGRMGGAYIATVTAFSAVNFHFLPPVVAWLWPTVIGLPLIARAIAANRRRRAAAAAAPDAPLPAL